MKPIVYGYSKCTTLKKSLKFLDNSNIEYTHIDNVQERLTQVEIKQLHERSELPIKRFFNTSGMRYRELGLKDKIANMTLDECYDLLASDGMLVKRPILVTEKGVVPSFKEDKWLEIL